MQRKQWLKMLKNVQYLTNKEASTELCYRFLGALQQNRAQLSFLYLFYDKEFNNFPTPLAEFDFSTQNLFFQASKHGISRALFSDKARCFSQSARKLYYEIKY